MTPTNEQITAEAARRWELRGDKNCNSLLHDIIEVVREGWTPPKPVDPDILAYREWSDTTADTTFRDAYLAGARMARERERERAKVLIGQAGELAIRYRNMVDSIRFPGWKNAVAFVEGVEAALAKYEEGLK